MTVKEATERDYKELERITNGAKNREEILETAGYWMRRAVSLNDTASWYEEAVQKIAPDKAEEVWHYVFSKTKVKIMREAKFVREHPWLLEVEMGQATEE